MDRLSAGQDLYRRPNGKTIEVANGMGGPNSLAFGKDGRLFVSEVFLWRCAPTRSISRTSTKPDFKPFLRTELRRIAEKMGGLNGFEIHKDDGFYGPLWFKGQVVKINLETGAIEVIAEGFKTRPPPT